MLYLVSTPIGNLADFSQRAIQVLSQSDLILCEDTRHSAILLQHYSIRVPLTPFHQVNEAKREEEILRLLREGKTLSLLSDAGTPLISDPGFSLVHACVRERIPFTAIPGPCSPIQALVLSGFSPARFQFLGFLPKEQEALRKTLQSALFYLGTSIAFESPNRLLDTLAVLDKLAPSRNAAVARELTKIHEECVRGSPGELLAHFEKERPRGEIVLLLEEGQPPEAPLGVEECVALLQELHGVSLKEAIRLAAKLQHIPKRDVYRLFHGG